MAEVILFDLAGKILSSLASHALNQTDLSLSANKDLIKLENKITTIRNILLDAQEQQKRKLVVKEWLRRLKIILQEADDLFDEVATEALRQDNVTDKSITRKVFDLFTGSNTVLFPFSLGKKIKDVGKKLDEFCADINEFKFLVGTLDKPIIKRNEGTTSFVDTQTIFGRDDDKKILLQLLLSSPSDGNVHIIPIVGMGGLGKTTLAQLIYNDNKIAVHFDTKLWVCVSNDFNVRRILTDILTDTGENSNNGGMEQLQISFRIKLSGKKFFLVLDDVWNDDPVEWKKLEELLMIGSRGSRVLVTTRDKKVANIVRTVKPYILKGLSEKECLSILIKWAFEKGEETKHPYLIKIGRDIVNKCGGVPLAARTLGVLLYSKTNRSEWLLVRDSEMWAQVQNENSIISILKMSYDQMPSSLKECFGYCSLFQKDEIIEKEQLMYHWIAHGLVQSSDLNVKLEDVCETYLEELLRRSFLEYASSAPNHEMDPVHYKMHDLIHDLAQYVVKGEYVSATSHTDHHVSFNDFSKIPKRLLKENNLRTIMRREDDEVFSCSVEKAILSCRRLRVLDYGTYVGLHDLPKDIEQLMYLRYLRYPGVKTVPKSLCKLLNLQFLDLPHSRFDDIPEDIGNLINLRVFTFSSSKLICLPTAIRSLSSLRKLIIGYSGKLRSLGTGLGSLTSLEHLEISYCEVLEFSNSEFQGLVSLKYLVLSYLPGLKQLPMGIHGMRPTLKHLRLAHCYNLILTEEVLPNLHSLEQLQIAYCNRITCLPEGIQCLRKLNHLEINNYPLAERCKPRGKDWPKIAHVACICVDGTNVRSR